MMRNKYDDEWILSHYEEYPSFITFHHAYCGSHDDVNMHSFKSHCLNTLHLAGVRENAYRDHISDDELSFLKSVYSDNGIEKTYVEYSKKFPNRRTKNAVKKICTSNGFRVNDRRKSISHTEINKNKIKHVGDTWVIKATGYPDGVKMICVSEDRSIPQFKRHIRLHRYVWEQHNGKIPKGMCVVFLDGNSMNCDIDNLDLVNERIKCKLATNRYNRTGFKQVTKTAITLCELEIALEDNKCY